MTRPEQTSPKGPTTASLSRSIPLLQGALAVSGLMPWAVASWMDGPPGFITQAKLYAVAGMSCILLLLGAATLNYRGLAGRYFASLGITGLLGIGALIFYQHPLVALIAMITYVSGLNLIWHVSANKIAGEQALPIRARGAALTALALWLLTTIGRPMPAAADLLAMSFAFLVVGTFVGRWARQKQRVFPQRVMILALAFILSLVIGAACWGNGWQVLSAFVLFIATTIFTLPTTKESTIDYSGWWEPLADHPERLFVGTFFALCLCGSVLLVLPQSATPGYSVSYLDAFFTAVSAVCVTGLVVVDTPISFTFLGQALILLLIQLGGLGIMTFSTVALRVLGRRMSMRHEGAVARLISHEHRGQLVKSARQILGITFGTEAVGALLLFWAFQGSGDTLGAAVWRAIFTSISAFCNAGFALQSDSLISYQSNPAVLHIVALLIIVGSISPVVILASPQLIKWHIHQISAQTKIILVVTLALLLGGFFFFLAFEWDNTLARLSLFDRINNAWLQSVTLRTAGFNSVDISAATPATLVLMMIWMFIGGSPGGTAGGIKTTTFALLVLLVVQTVRGRGGVVIFGRSLSAATLHKAAVVAFLGIFAVVSATVALLLTQALSANAALFEVFSAFGTVGLSVGATPKLDGVGKLIIITCMFAGRVGPLTLLMFMGRRGATSVIKRPEEDIDVG